MNQTIKFNLLILALLVIYLVIRLIGISSIDLNTWQAIYIGNGLKDTLLLILTILLTRSVFVSIKSNPKKGPTIISAKKLKVFLYLCLGLLWTSVAMHTLFDSITIAFPFSLTNLYRFSEFMDETISHLLLFIPMIVIFFTATILEIERPLLLALKNRELLFLGFLSIIMGTFLGLNLTEGALSLITSLPLTIALFTYLMILKRKHHLNFRNWPWGFFSIITSTSASLGLSIWSLSFYSAPQLFTLIK